MGVWYSAVSFGLGVKNKIAQTHFKTQASSHLQENIPVVHPNQNEKPGGEPTICLAGLIKTWKYVGHEEDLNRFGVKRPQLLHEDNSSKFDSCSQLQEKV